MQSDQSEERDLQLLALVMAAHFELMERQDAEYIALMASAGCDAEEIKAAMREDRRVD
jgi:hypothetical protein